MCKKSLDLKKSNSRAHLEHGTYEQIVSHLEKEEQLEGLEAPDQMQENTVTHQATKPNPEKPKPICHHYQKPGLYINQCRQLKRQKDQNDTNKNSAGNNQNSNNNSGQTNSNTHNNKTVSNGNANIANNRNDRKPTIVYKPCEMCGKTNYSTENWCFAANAAGIEDRWNKDKVNKTHRSMQLRVFRLRPKL